MKYNESSTYLTTFVVSISSIFFLSCFCASSSGVSPHLIGMWLSRLHNLYCLKNVDRSCVIDVCEDVDRDSFTHALRLAAGCSLPSMSVTIAPPSHGILKGIGVSPLYLLLGNLIVDGQYKLTETTWFTVHSMKVSTMTVGVCQFRFCIFYHAR